MKHLYVHIPFCRSRCAYCDFVSEPVGPRADEGRMEHYLRALRVELAERLQPYEQPGDAASLETIYLGGGTPTVLPHNQLLGLVEELSAKLAVDPSLTRSAAPEFTIEANPGTINSALLGWLLEAGVTRLSLGVQSFSGPLRDALGRWVSQTEISEALAAVRSTRWEEWNLDLVFGIPGQDWKMAAADVDRAVEAGPTHISMYDLTYTPAFRARLETDTPERYAAFTETYFSEAVARLEAAGYRRYEVSNFALPGHECRHNQAYWRGEDYVGIGVSAVSTVGTERRTNPRTVDGYLAGDPPEIETLSPETRLWEKAMLGLRTAEGVDESEVRPVLDPASYKRLLGQGCLETRYGKLRLNKGFLDVSNAVIAALLVRPGGS
jgi:oxygen-independent coproporphyrinogen-3 oxidase